MVIALYIVSSSSEKFKKLEKKKSKKFLIEVRNSQAICFRGYHTKYIMHYELFWGQNCEV